VPPPPTGLVWRDLGDHKYQPERLLRLKNGQVVPDDPNADPYSAYPIEVKPDGSVVKLGFQALTEGTVQPAEDDKLAKAEEALLAGNATLAARLATESLEAGPSANAYLVRASANNSLGNYKQAVQDASNGLQLAPGNQMLIQAQEAASSHIEKHDAVAPPLSGPDHSKDTDNTGWVVVQEKPRPEPARSSGGGVPAFWIALALLTALGGAGGGFYLASQWAKPKRDTVYANTDLTQSGSTSAPPEPRATAVPAEPAPFTASPGVALKPGLLKGRFELRGKIGIGGMGIVYDGFDHSLGRRVAIKQMRAELKEFPEEVAAFLSEARIISHLSHPYIVAFHDVVEEKGEVYLVFDFVDGKPLSQILWEKKRLTLKETQTLYTYVCEAITCAHENHVLHRDLKPANIMVDKAGYAKVMDFGIAREAKETITRLTHADTAGTPWYMAPEQHLGKCAKASDIYALGVCLYESMTGKLPFPGPDFLAQKERMKYTPPQFLAPELPREAELLFIATLNPDPKKRVATAAELLDSLKSLKG
jgi:hypothetical protein